MCACKHSTAIQEQPVQIFAIVYTFTADTDTLLYLHYYLQFSFGQQLTILLMKSLFPLQQFWLLPWQCKQWEEEEEWRALTSLLDPPSPLQALLSRAATLLGHEGCILLFRLNRVRGTSSSSTEHCHLLSECLFCNSAWSKKKKIRNNNSTFCKNVMWLTCNLYSSLSHLVSPGMSSRITMDGWENIHICIDKILQDKINASVI